MLSFFASVIATPFGLDGHAATIAAARRVVRKNSVTRSKARGSIRDAIRRGSDWRGLHMIPRGDGAIGLLVVATRGRRIGNTQTQRSVSPISWTTMPETPSSLG